VAFVVAGCIQKPLLDSMYIVRALLLLCNTGRRIGEYRGEGSDVLWTGVWLCRMLGALQDARCFAG
jgi:hypothetical protein